MKREGQFRRRKKVTNVILKTAGMYAVPEDNGPKPFLEPVTSTSRAEREGGRGTQHKKVTLEANK